jgi:signal transduction histidine kinase
VRGYIFELKPGGDSHQSFAGRIADLAQNFEVNTLASAHVDLDLGALESLGSTTQSHIAHICREALSNIARHARAGEVHITFAHRENDLVFEITDDGVGFDPDSVGRGNGLTNMADRARLLGGRLEIEPHSPKGTVHRVILPEGTSTRG